VMITLKRSSGLVEAAMDKQSQQRRYGVACSALGAVCWLIVSCSLHAGDTGFLKGTILPRGHESIRCNIMSVRATPLPSDRFQDWTDYTRVALGVEDRSSTQPWEEPVRQQQKRQQQQPQQQEDSDMRKLNLRMSAKIGPRFKVFVERQRALGIDFGPSITGLALSLGGTNTIPMGTLETGDDWKETAIKIVQIASTRRVRELVVGLPLEKDGTLGKIGRLVRHFVQILADATLLVLGPGIPVYVWDERFSTAYAAVRLVATPKLASDGFKNWINGQRGLSYSGKALLDAESARAILEHFQEMDPNTEKINKERAERISPSKEACLRYLAWKKRKLLRPMQPSEPAGPGREGFEWDNYHPELAGIDAEDFDEENQNFEGYMQGVDSKGFDRFGDEEYEYNRYKEEMVKEQEIHRRIKEERGDDDKRSVLEEAIGAPRRPEYKGKGPSKVYAAPER